VDVPLATFVNALVKMMLSKAAPQNWLPQMLKHSTILYKMQVRKQNLELLHRAENLEHNLLIVAFKK